MHPHALPSWVIERSRLMNRFPPLEPERSALIVVDMQRAFIAADAPFANPHAQEIVPNINRLVRAFRSAGAHICWTRHTSVEEGPRRLPAWQLFDGSLPSLSRGALCRGAPAWELHEELEVERADLVFDKYRFSAFVNAQLDLDVWLRGRGVEAVIIVGTVTNCCCESTARDAAARDYQAYVVGDATAAVTDEEHRAALLNIAAVVGRIVTTDELLALISAGASQNHAAASQVEEESE